VLFRSAQALLAALGVFQVGLAKSRVDDLKVQGHIYEYTTRVGISSIDDTVKLTTEKIVPVQLLFCLKENNAKKINSHRWCFQAIGQVLDPRIVVLLDCGTQPAGKSLYHLWQEFDKDAQVAGACGEIKASLKKRQMITNPLVYGQNFEYKISNILDKPTESVFGFISVLPGAFSAYRFVALQNDINGRGPLEKYFKGEFLHGSGELDPNDDEYEMKMKLMSEKAGIFTSNMYLAEDRILCFELVAKQGCSWLLRYVKSASAETDVPEGLAEFILQRRRWLNGSFFAAIYSLAHFPKLWKSSHSISRQFFLHVEFVYQFLNLVVSWFSLSSYFLVFRILTTSLSDPELNFSPGKYLSAIFLWLYLASIVTTFVLSFGNKPKGTEKFYIVIVVFFAILMAYMIFAAIFLAVHSIQAIYESQTKITVSLFLRNAEFRDLVVATSSTYALYFVASFMYFEPWHMFTSFLQYILLSPSYVNVLNIYAFCNIDDVSWGTKGDTGAKDLGAAKVREDGSYDVAIPIHQEAINQSYLNQLEKIKRPQEPPQSSGGQSNEDYYAFVRSMTVLVWMFTNFIIIALVLETGGVSDFEASSGLPVTKDLRAKVFLTVILWLVAFMALFRFIGCTLYLFQRIGTLFKGSDRRGRQRV
jgi:chitin synthase